MIRIINEIISETMTLYIMPICKKMDNVLQIYFFTYHHLPVKMINKCLTLLNQQRTYEDNSIDYKL